MLTEKTQRNVLYVSIAVVALWISIDVTDSTVLKPYLLIGTTFLLAALWLSNGIARGKVTWLQSGPDLPVCFALVFLALSWTISAYRQFGVIPLLTVAGISICFYAGTQLFVRRDQVRQAIDILGLLSLVICLFALVQYFAGDEMGIRFGLGSSKRVMSTMGNSTYLGGFLAMMTVMMLGITIAGDGGRRKVLSAILAGLMFLVLVLTQSRGAIIATGVSVVLFFTLLKGSGIRWVIIGVSTVVVLFGLTILLPEFVERFSFLTDPLADYSFARRIPFWTAGWKAFLSSPLIGHGPGSILYVIPSYRTADYWIGGSEDIVPHVHNQILEVGIESGLPGVLLFFIIIVMVIRAGTKELNAVNIGIVCALIAILLEGMTGIALLHPPVAMVAWFLMGVLASGGADRKKTEWQLSRGWRRITWAPIVVWSIGAFFLAKDAIRTLESDKALQSGRIAMQAGRHRIALDHFRLATERKTSSMIASFELCIAQLKSGEYRDALTTASTIRASVPDYPKVRLLESLAWLQLDSLTRATETIERELAQRDHPEAYYTQSLIGARLDDTLLVRQSLEHVLERNIAGYTRIHLESSCRTLLGIARTRGDLDRLRYLLEELEDRQPDDPMVNEMLRETRDRLTRRTTF